MKSERAGNLGKRAASALMLLLWLGTFALTASPQLHTWLHPDAQNPGHRCVATQIQEHGVIGGFTPAVVPLPVPTILELVYCPDSQFLPRFDYRLSLSRAPPLVSTFCRA